MHNDELIFITGATGFVGTQLVRNCCGLFQAPGSHC